MKKSILIVAISLLGCRYAPSGPGPEPDTGSADTGGSTVAGSGGSSGAANGGSAGSSTGGSTETGTGGRTGSGGTTGSGGATSTGGTTARGTGGSPGTGGMASGGTSGSPADAGRDSGSKDTGSGGDTTAQVSYGKQIAPLLAANCYSCHASSVASGGIILDNYTDVKANASLANSAIQSGIMPPTGALSTANKQLFQTWVSEGAQDN